MQTMINTILSADYSLATVLGWTILHSIWQIALIALVLKVLLNWTSKHAANVRYGLSLLAMLGALIWSASTFFTELEAYHVLASQTQDSASFELSSTLITTSEVQQTFLSSLEESIRLLTLSIEPIMPYLAIAWLLGMLFFASRILVGLVRLRTFSRRGTQLLSVHWQARFEQLKQLSGIRQKVEIRVSELVPVPITYRFFRPIILLPVSVFTGLSDEQIEVLLLHELAHIRRHDYIVNLIQSVVEVLFFYHPFIWWISKNVRAEREHCCDDEVLKLRHQPMLYAQTLTQIQSQHLSFKTNLAMSANGNKGVFTQRIYRLFQQPEPYSKLRNAATALLLLLFSGMTMAFYPNQVPPKADVTVVEVVSDTVPTTIKTQNIKGIKKSAPSTINKVETTRIDENTKVIEVTSVPKASGIIETKSSDQIIVPGKKVDEVITIKSPEATYQIDSNEGEKVDLKIENEKEPLTLNSVNGKKPVIYLDGQPYSDWEMDDQGKIKLDITAEEIKTVDILGGNSNDASDIGDESDVIKITTKNNEGMRALSIPKDEKIVLGTKKVPDSEQPLFIINGKKVKVPMVEKIDPKDILKINVLKGASALEKYGSEATNGVVEIIMKGNKENVKSKKRKKVDRKLRENRTQDKENQNGKTTETSTIKEPKIFKPKPSLVVFPNPAERIVNIQLKVEKKGHSKVVIYNKFGELMKTVVDQTLDKGNYEFKWDSKGQTSDSYYIHFNFEGETIAQQFFVVNE